MLDENQFESLGEQRDTADLDTLYQIYSSLGMTLDRALTAPAGSLEARGVKDIGLILRLSIVHVWQEPRMVRTGTNEKLHGHGKPLLYPWSKRARDLFFDSISDDSVSLSGQLVGEHCVPIDVHRKHLQGLILAGCTKQEWVDAFLESQSGLNFAIVTKKDDRGLDKKKLRTVLLAGDPSPWARYAAAGLPRESFMALVDDPRWEAYMAPSVPEPDLAASV